MTEKEIEEADIEELKEAVKEYEGLYHDQEYLREELLKSYSEIKQYLLNAYKILDDH